MHPHVSQLRGGPNADQSHKSLVCLGSSQYDFSSLGGGGSLHQAFARHAMPHSSRGTLAGAPHLGRATLAVRQTLTCRIEEFVAACSCKDRARGAGPSAEGLKASHAMIRCIMRMLGRQESLSSIDGHAQLQFIPSIAHVCIACGEQYLVHCAGGGLGLCSLQFPPSS